MGKTTRRKVKSSIKIIKLSELQEEFLENCKHRGLSPSTIKDYEFNLNLLLRAVGDLALTEINKKNICLPLIDYLERNLNYNNTSKNMVFRISNLFLKYLHKKYNTELIRLDFMKERKKVKTVYSEVEIKILLTKPSNNSYTEYRNFVALQLAFNLGLRLSSIVSLKVEDIDLKNRTLTIPHTKNRQPLILPLKKELLLTLKEYIDECEIKNHLMEDNEGNALGAEALKSSIRRYNTKRGVKLKSIHACRHTFAVRFYKQTKNLVLLQLILGHHSPEVTQKYLSSLGVTDFEKELLNFDLLK